VKSRRVTFVGYSETEKNFRVFDRERRKVFVSCNIKFNETKMMDEFYCEQEIGSGYGDEYHVEFVPSSRHEEIKKRALRAVRKSAKNKKRKILVIRSQGLSRHLG